MKGRDKETDREKKEGRERERVYKDRRRKKTTERLIEATLSVTK